MSEPGVLGESSAADARQGGYFRDMLVIERNAVTRELAERRVAVQNASGTTVHSQLESELLARQSELERLNGLIEALDARFSSLWSRT